jgi:hypothetical protein
MNWLTFLTALTEQEREELKATLADADKNAEFFDALAANDALTAAERIIRRREGKIPAIKAVRERTRLGLKEAKDLVERCAPDDLYTLPACPKCGCWKERVKPVAPLSPNESRYNGRFHKFHCLSCDWIYEAKYV